MGNVALIGKTSVFFKVNRAITGFILKINFGLEPPYHITNLGFPKGQINLVFGHIGYFDDFHQNADFISLYPLVSLYIAHNISIHHQTVTSASLESLLCPLSAQIQTHELQAEAIALTHRHDI